MSTAGRFQTPNRSTLDVDPDVQSKQTPCAWRVDVCALDMDLGAREVDLEALEVDLVALGVGLSAPGVHPAWVLFPASEALKDLS